LSQSEEAVTTWDTGIDADLLTFLGEKSVKYPESFVGFKLLKNII